MWDFCENNFVSNQTIFDARGTMKNYHITKIFDSRPLFFIHSIKYSIFISIDYVYVRNISNSEIKHLFADRYNDFSRFEDRENATMLLVPIDFTNRLLYKNILHLYNTYEPISRSAYKRFENCHNSMFVSSYLFLYIHIFLNQHYEARQ